MNAMQAPYKPDFETISNRPRSRPTAALNMSRSHLKIGFEIDNMAPVSRTTSGAFGGDCAPLKWVRLEDSEKDCLSKKRSTDANAVVLQAGALRRVHHPQSGNIYMTDTVILLWIAGDTDADVSRPRITPRAC